MGVLLVTGLEVCEEGMAIGFVVFSEKWLFGLVAGTQFHVVIPKLVPSTEFEPLLITDVGVGSGGVSIGVVGGGDVSVGVVVGGGTAVVVVVVVVVAVLRRGVDEDNAGVDAIVVD
jgi:hypothetical protein